MTVSVSYTWTVSPDVDTPLRPGEYRIRIVEGGQYRNAASGRVYSVREIVPSDPPKIRYAYTRGENAEHVERVGEACELAVVQAVGGTPTAVKQYLDNASSNGGGRGR